MCCRGRTPAKVIRILPDIFVTVLLAEMMEECNCHRSTGQRNRKIKFADQNI